MPDGGVLDQTERVQARISSNGLLYSAVEWFDGKPILDGMPYFATKAHALDHAKKHEEIAASLGVNITYTIIRLEKGT